MELNLLFWVLMLCQSVCQWGMAPLLGVRLRSLPFLGRASLLASFLSLFVSLSLSHAHTSTRVSVWRPQIGSLVDNCGSVYAQSCLPSVVGTCTRASILASICALFFLKILFTNYLHSLNTHLFLSFCLPHTELSPNRRRPFRCILY